MEPAYGNAFVRQAITDGVPRLAVLLRCRNWGLPASRAADFAEEAAAEAYQRSLDRRFNDSNHFRAWVTRTAINVTVDLLRQQRRTISSSLVAEIGFEPNRGNQLKDALADALETLSPEQRLILDLTYEQEMSLDEIAERLLPEARGSANAKRLRIKRQRDEAIRRLRRFLEDALHLARTPDDRAVMLVANTRSRETFPD